jgi:hypothetical protein
MEVLRGLRFVHGKCAGRSLDTLSQINEREQFCGDVRGALSHRDG